MNSQYICKLPSTDGRTTFSLEISDLIEINDEKYYVSSIRIHCINWESKELLDNNRELETEVDNFIINLSQVLIPLSNLHKLTSYVELWVHNYEDFEIELVDLSFQKIVIKIQSAKKSVLDKYKPSFIFDYEGYRIPSLVSSFIVDETCLSTFVDGVKGVKGISN